MLARKTVLTERIGLKASLGLISNMLLKPKNITIEEQNLPQPFNGTFEKHNTQSV